MEIESVPMLGATWYERGRVTGLRRVFMVICGAGVLALVFAAFWAVRWNSTELGDRLPNRAGRRDRLLAGDYRVSCRTGEALVERARH
jgi:hypothetical protein